MTQAPRRSARGRALRILAALCALLLFAGFVALGNWQVQRRTWKLDLIERVGQRVHAAPVAPLPATDWPSLSAARDEYRHLRLAGRFLPGRDTLVQASTVRGPGFWLLAPLQLADGSVVLVNRGYVPSLRHGAGTPSGLVEVEGLLRLSEPGGGFLRHNDPAGERWYSRDVAAIAAARGLDKVAPYFVDAAADTAAGPAEPVGGLTVISFANSHLVYALTWYGLALLVAGAAAVVAVHNARRHAEHAAALPD
jgi:surfeit locus 1 family protein